MAEKLADLEDWGANKFAEVSGRKLRNKCENVLRELEAIEGEVVSSKVTNIGRGISVVTHLYVKGEKANKALVGVEVAGKQFTVATIEVDAKNTKEIGDIKPIRYEVPKTVLEDRLEKLAVTLREEPGADGRLAKILFEGIDVRFPGESRYNVMLTGHALEKESIYVEHEEKQVKKCLKTNPVLDEWRRRSEFEGKNIGKKQA